MAFTDVLSNVSSTITGNVTKAKIWIKDQRNRTTITLNKEQMEKLKTGSSIGLADLGIDEEALASAVAAAAAAMEKAGKVLEAFDINITSDYNKYIEVQFNPSSLRLNSYAGDEDAQLNNYTQTGANISRGAVDRHIELSFKLIFDSMSNMAAFQQDMMTASSSSVASAAKSLITGFFSSGTSVQMAVEGFVGIMRNENTRFVCFEWGEFKYEGLLSRVNSNYTAFDMNGNPVRAEVSVVMYLVDPAVGKGEETGYWFDAYYAAYIENNPTARLMKELAKLQGGLL